MSETPLEISFPEDSVLPLKPVIDYTSRDYQSLRTDMIRMIRARIPQWEANNPSDFGLALVEAFAYAIDTLHYYLDRVANEAYLDSAVQRESLYSIAKMFNYSPQPPTPASITLEFTNSTLSEVVVPQGTRCQASIQADTGVVLKNYETVSEIAIPPQSSVLVNSEASTARVMAVEGRTYYDETIGVSTGFVRQSFMLPRTSVIQDTVRITSYLGESILEWREVPDLEAVTPYDRAFQVVNMTDGSSIVQFGDGLHGAVPDLHSVLRASYRVGGGSDGNVPPYSVTAVVEPILYGVSVTNPFPAVGGMDAESLSSIRVNSARSFRSRDRAVTLADFVVVAEATPGVSQAKVIGNNSSSVTVYAIPVSDSDIVSRPPITTMTGEMRLLTMNYLEERSMAGVTVSVFGPSWETFYVRLVVNVLDTAKQSVVEGEIRSRLAKRFGFENADFDQVISAQDILTTLNGIAGVGYVELTNLSLDQSFPTVQGQSPTKSLIMDDISPSSVPFWDPDISLSLTLEGGVLS